MSLSIRSLFRFHRSDASRRLLRSSRAVRPRRLVATLCTTAALTASAAETPEADDPASDDKHAITLDTFVIEGRIESPSAQAIESRALKLHKIVDLAEILSSELVEASLVRKSGYGNEVSLRGFSQANLPILINGGFLEGACGGRKDTALSHINLLTVERIVVREGPFDVTRPGDLGGYIDVVTKQPEVGLSGDALLRLGSYGFRSAGITATGGTARVQIRAGYNFSSSGQYADGDGTELWELREGRTAPFTQDGRDADAFSKHDTWGSLRVSPNDAQAIQLDYAFGEATDILNPRGDFDTERETTKLTRATWTASDLGPVSEKLTLTAYYNAVGHHPTQELRDVAVPKRIIARSTITGASLLNEFHTADVFWTCGIDTFDRRWTIDVFNALTGATLNAYLMPKAETLDLGAFVRGERALGTWQLSAGARLDDYRTEAHEPLPQSARVTTANRRVDRLPGGYVTARHVLSEHSQIFAGIGRSYRIPTSAERYIQSNATYFGNPTLEPTANTELDLGWRTSARPWTIEAKAFHADLEDYIYQVSSDLGYQTYANIDARIFGADARASCTLGSGFTIDGGIAWQRGRKESLPVNNTDRDLGQMSPLKTRLALDYERAWNRAGTRPVVFATAEWLHGNASRDVDEAAGEKVLPAWDVANVRCGCRLGAWSLTAGIDNLFDETYAVANSYEWDVVGGTGSNPIIVNEPGRFVYVSVGCGW